MDNVYSKGERTSINGVHIENIINARPTEKSYGEAFLERFSDFIETGKDLLEELTESLKEKTTTTLESIGNIVGKISAAIARFLGISSEETTDIFEATLQEVTTHNQSSMLKKFEAQEDILQQFNDQKQSNNMLGNAILKLAADLTKENAEELKKLPLERRDNFVKNAKGALEHDVFKYDDIALENVKAIADSLEVCVDLEDVWK